MGNFREKEFYKSVKVIPYSVILDSIKSMLETIAVEYEDDYLVPDNIIVYFSPDDRKVREKIEDVLIDELTRDVIRYLKLDFPEKPISKLRVQIRSNNKLMPLSFRIQGFFGEKLLYSKIHHESEPEEKKKEKKEWDAVDIYEEESSSERSILVVDDEPVLCAILDKMLTRLGYQVVSAHNGVEAMKILSRMNIDLVISDLRMPQMDGWTLMKYSKDRYPNLPFILITGYHSIHTQSRASKSSADGYLSKPFSVQQIKSLLENVLSKKDDANSAVTYLSNEE